MEPASSKKWFIYMGDHHEGPISEEDILAKVGAAHITPSTFVWTEGMGDWKPMRDVPALESLLKEAGVPTSDPTQRTGEIRVGPEITVSKESTKTGTVIPPNYRANLGPKIVPSPKPSLDIDETHNIEKKEKTIKQKGPVGVRKAISILVLLVLVGVAVGGYFSGYLNPFKTNADSLKKLDSGLDSVRSVVGTVVEKVPALGFLTTIISPIPALDSVSEEEMKLLREAAVASLSQNGPQVAIGIPKSEVMMPIFYIASNLPNGTVFQIDVRGVPESLLNHTEFKGETKVTIEKRLGKSQTPIRFEGKPVPKGFYEVVVSLAEGQTDDVKKTTEGKIIPKKPILLKKIFFGGVQDATYTSRLKEYHDRLLEKAKNDITELKQYVQTIEYQLTTSSDTFIKLKKGKLNKAQQKNWNTFDTKWSALNKQIKDAFVRWTPENLKQEHFYSGLYELFMRVYSDIEKAHQMHQSYFQGKSNPTSFDIQRGEALSQATTGLTTLKAKIERIEKQPTTPGGLPTKEGL